MPGISENQLWSIFYKSIIEQDGDYCETRLLSSGEKKLIRGFKRQVKK